MTELLLELGPDALIGASATAAFPPRMQPILDRLRNEKGWGDEQFVTAVASRAVVDAGLVKERIQLGGYLTPMELAVDDLLSEHGRATVAARELGLRPKAIYVTETNTIDGSTDAEDVKRPFAERRARPILIWRHLVARGVDPSRIAVYLQLKFDKRAPPPPGFVLFSGSDDDYDRFVAGDFEHVIFNRTLQEGWDDPACGFAYIDKSMGSAAQVTQIIGRVLRQPGGRHYSDPILNTAHFYIRTDAKGVFEDVLRDVEHEITTDGTGIKVTVRRATSRATPSYLDPKGEFTLPSVNIYSREATAPMRAIMDNVIDFTDGGAATRGVGAHIQVLRTIGDAGHEVEEWVEVERGNPVTARTLFRREVHRLFPGALGRAISPINLVDIEHPKFDALVEFNSPAEAHLRDMARQVVDAYIEHSIVVQDNHDLPFRVGPTVRDEAMFQEFENAAHGGYSKLNDLERPFAEALDRTGRQWCRNPDRGGFEIPLLDRGPTRTFNPDFIVWTDEAIFAIDPKADHLIKEAAVRKLFALHRIGEGPPIQIRLVTKGAWTADDSGYVQARDRERGFTVWRYRNGRVKATAVDTVASAVATCLQSDGAVMEAAT
jgi:type III restriction enzyme